MGINKEYEMVKEFQRVFSHPYADTPTLMDIDRAQARYEWMKEEIDEFIEATEKGDLYEQADAMIDLIYFALGTLVEIGIEPENLFKIVQNANMSKLWDDGNPHYNDIGKVLKPSDWQDPYSLFVEEINKQSRSTGKK